MRNPFIYLFIFIGFSLININLVHSQSNFIQINYSESIDDESFRSTLRNMGGWIELSEIQKSDKGNESIHVRYKMAANFEYLYLLIESDSDSIVNRDRAYQNGDGLHMVLAKPNNSGSTDEFYVLRFSPQKQGQSASMHKGIWYYNIDLWGKPLSKKCSFNCFTQNNKSYFELLLPWQDVYPYHPLFSEEIGINFCFVKAIGRDKKNYYFLKFDDKIQSEQSKRLYIPVKFEIPETIHSGQTYIRAVRNNVLEGQELPLHIISYSPKKNKFGLKCYLHKSNVLLDSFEITKNRKKGKNTFDIEINSKILSQGSYKLVWKSSDKTTDEIDFGILPGFNAENEEAAIQKSANSLCPGDKSTFKFYIRQIELALKNLKTYETGYSIIDKINQYRQLTIELDDKSSALLLKTGIYRRAYLSSFDSSLQPFTIKIPSDFNKNKKYPLFVMLHGSGADDQDILKNFPLTDDFIAIAPFGRGTSNCFTTENAQIDIREVVEETIKYFPIDTNHMIIAGFSMGGYGALRTFYEYPGLFCAVAVFSGHPNLASKWIGDGFPDFLNDEYLKSFKNIPVFIYHSKNDLNCPYPLIEQLKDKLLKSGAQIDMHTSEDGGHQIIESKSINPFHNWLKEIVFE